jgi:fatty acid synthase
MASKNKQLMTEIYDESGINPSELSFLEAHGTGTQVGDPQEVEAIDDALARKRHKPLLVGSVKSNMGLTEPASGVCSHHQSIDSDGNWVDCS